MGSLFPVSSCEKYETKTIKANTQNKDYEFKVTFGDKNIVNMIIVNHFNFLGQKYILNIYLTGNADYFNYILGECTPFMAFRYDVLRLTAKRIKKIYQGHINMLNENGDFNAVKDSIYNMLSYLMIDDYDAYVESIHMLPAVVGGLKETIQDIKTCDDRFKIERNDIIKRRLANKSMERENLEEFINTIKKVIGCFSPTNARKIYAKFEGL